MVTVYVRFKVIVDVATALVYLHTECEERIIHRDVKAANVMLNAKFNARLGDFRLARLQPQLAGPGEHQRGRHLRLPGAGIIPHRCPNFCLPPFSLNLDDHTHHLLLMG